MKNVRKLIPIRNLTAVKVMKSLAKGVAIPVTIRTAFEEMKLPYRP